jgi:hypothetical protein
MTRSERESPLHGPHNDDACPICGGHGVDDREEAQALFSNLKRALPALQQLLARCDEREEDGVYRFWSQSFKVYGRLQPLTLEIVAALQTLAPERKLNAWFLQIVKDGTGKTFEEEHNRRWSEVTRPIVEAFFHAEYFLRMAVRYGRELKQPPLSLPSGWAALICLYELW